jgi:hypothetical protein
MHLVYLIKNILFFIRRQGLRPLTGLQQKTPLIQAGLKL